MEKIIIPHQFQKGVGANATKFNQNFETVKEAINKAKDDLDNKSEISLENLNETGLDKILPAGSVIMLPRNSVPAASRLLYCNGAAVSRVSYPRLFAAIGTMFGAGNGSSTFNIPDYRGKFLRCNGGLSNNNMFVPQAEGLPNITGAITTALGIGVFAGQAGYGNAIWAENANPSSYMGFSPGTALNRLRFSASASSSIYGASAHVTPENFCIAFYIRF